MSEHELLKMYPCVKGVYYFARSNAFRVIFHSGVNKIFYNEESFEEYVDEHKEELN